MELRKTRPAAAARMSGRRAWRARARFIWFHPVVGLVYETTAEQMRRVLEGFRAMFASDPRVERETARVRWIALGGSSLDGEVFAYVRVATFPEFLAVQEELLRKILEVVGAAGTALAFPSRTVYLRQDQPASVQRG